VIQGIFSVIQGTFGAIQGTFGGSLITDDSIKFRAEQVRGEAHSVNIQ
jgi:hypothetical protein